MNKMTLAKKIKSAVETLVKEDCGCFTIKLDEKLAVCIGWASGYNTKDIDVIHSKENPTWCINAGIKVWTSDSLRTDFDFINSPYFEDGAVWDTDGRVSPHENYEMLAEYLLKEYKEMLRFEIEDDGKIIGHKNLWVCERCLYAIESREGDMLTRIHRDNAQTCDWCGEEFEELYELI